MLLAALLACAIPGTTIQGEDELTDLDRRVMQELTGRRETPRVTFHWRPDAIDREVLDQDVVANLAALAELEDALGMHYRGHVQVFLYADEDELERLTGSDAVAFSTGTVSVHQPHDFRGVHEFVHIYALQFEPIADGAGPDLFATEGLATWLAKSDQDVPIHAWAAAYARAGRLPDAIELRRTFPEGAGDGVHPYHVAGSFVGFLVGRFGMAKVKRWYMDSTEAYRYFGEGMGSLAREWREFLGEYDLDPDHEQHVRSRIGLGGRPLPAAWTSAELRPLFDGDSLEGLSAEEPSLWSVKDGVLSGSNDAPWTHLVTTEAYGPQVGVRARLRLVRGDAIKLRLAGKEAIFARWSSYVGSGEGYVANETVKIPLGDWVDLVAADDAGRACVYLNGACVFDLEGAWSDAGESSLALGVERGLLEVEAWGVFEVD